MPCVFSFSLIFKTYCERESIHDCAAIWLFPQIMRVSAEAASAHRGCTTEEYVAQQAEEWTIYRLPVLYLLDTYAIYEVITESKVDRTNLKQLKDIAAGRYLDMLWELALSCDPVYDECCFTRFIIAGKHKSILSLMRTNWNALKIAPPQNSV